MKDTDFLRPVTRAVLSGSFKRDPDGLAKAYYELNALGIQILSPHAVNFVSEEHGFVKTAAEQNRSYEELQRHHVSAIDEADFVWLHAPEGYVGTSAGFEIGYAIAKGIPVFTRATIPDPAMAMYVTVCNSLFDALYTLKS